ncbi:1-amino-cyclopropane-1-carboxylate synthase 7 [Perilla frutescens var. hirtella]|uniref:1-amino-cyclopropane-1-carboxylate synthase 7 n=1 Tax=Perilla frutescens var. hirtella TaxID=608512 RepID=A0AAD4JAT2_PERFH|nr:1-amino-cyclopropane-1-carboxylate synthase 7 [Perilla frutescens var. hirtella]
MAIKSLEQSIIVGLSRIAVSNTHGEDSQCFIGWKAYDEYRYDESSNLSGVIQMRLAKNQVSFDILEQYLENNSNIATINGGRSTSSFIHCF